MYHGSSTTVFVHIKECGNPCKCRRVEVGLCGSKIGQDVLYFYIGKYRLAEFPPSGRVLCAIYNDPEMNDILSRIGGKDSFVGSALGGYFRLIEPGEGEELGEKMRDYEYSGGDEDDDDN